VKASQEKVTVASMKEIDRFAEGAQREKEEEVGREE
jgi:hypothetical protein